MNRITKFFTVAAIGAAGVVGLASQAGATVAVTDGVGHVDKGDVQSAFEWNNKQFDANVASIKFTAGTQVMGNQSRWQCSGGEQSQTSLVTQKRTVKATQTTSANGRQINGWDLTGFGFEYVSGKRVGAPYVGYCPAGEAFGGFLPNVFTTDITDGGLTVTAGTVTTVTVDLPNTPLPV